MTKIFLTLFIMAFFVSCETDEQIALVLAQKCLNETSVAEAANCKTYLEGHNSKEAYVLRCSADFLAEGVNANQMASALEKRDQAGTSGNSLLGMMGVISFRTPALAQVAKSDCTQSGYSSYLMLSEMATISSKMVSLDSNLAAALQNGTKPSQEDFNTSLPSIIATANSETTNETKELIGQAAASIQTNYCQAEKDTSKVCTTISNAISTNTTNAAIGAALLTALQSNL